MRRIVDILKDLLEGAPEVRRVDQAVQMPMAEGGRPNDVIMVQMTDGRIYQVQAKEVLS